MTKQETQDQEPTDLVLSYVIPGTKIQEIMYEPVKAALKSGYRIVDVIQSTPAVGGATAGYGSVVVTVVLSKDADSSPYYWMKKVTKG